ncbi:MAG: type II toxin-antitoxin system RelE/ParE family toxin [Gammaproteobacteria bacterium]|nr:type II toxin-antitoxin system RelE/ParE family toxin [Gammaproteobacteria bacterium]MBU2182884.1 type II toxin-antitoxin system RelE/ParE family toxin [Gammaproteobacteria bacterium]MBU2203470.1 type II toxin-antitoxin system RelE/ParE family toxin [Gammaproteobacteria bacterium]
MRLTVLTTAAAELDDAVYYYENELPGLGRRFLNEVLLAFGRIADFPDAYPLLSTQNRRCLLAKFPYGILYHYDKSAAEIIVVAIGHLHRKPDYWLSKPV